MLTGPCLDKQILQFPKGHGGARITQRPQRWLRLDQGIDGSPGVFVEITHFHFSWRTRVLMRVLLGWRIVDRPPP